MDIKEYIETNGLIQCGQRLKYTITDEFILAFSSSGEACLISLSTGNRYRDAIDMNGQTMFAYDDMLLLTDGDIDNFEVIE